MLGDNIYGRETAKDFFKKFELPYKPLLDAGVPFYAALGNHDDPVIQVNYKPFNMDGKRYYSFRKGDVECFAIDSTYMSTEQVRWVEKALSESSGAVEDRLHASPHLLVRQAPRVRGRRCARSSSRCSSSTA